jgi:hypothetical protein
MLKLKNSNHDRMFMPSISREITHKEILDLVKIYHVAILELSIKLNDNMNHILPVDRERANFVLGTMTLHSSNLEHLLQTPESIQNPVNQRLIQESQSFAKSIQREGLGLWDATCL